MSHVPELGRLTEPERPHNQLHPGPPAQRGAAAKQL